MAHKIQLRGDTLANWTNENPVLWVNEPAIETNDGKFKMKVGDGVKEYLDLPYLAGEGGLSGTNYVFVRGDGTPSENAAELQAAYNKAKTMSPNSGNTVTVVVAPGTYTFGGNAFIVDTPYINVVSLTGNPDVLLNGINVTVNNVYLKGLNCGVNTFTVATNLNGLSCERCVGGDFSFGGYGDASGIFTNCTGGNDSFGGYDVASGIFTNCTGGDGSFGGNGLASGIFTNCTGGNDSFGGGGISSTARLYYCRLTSGTFGIPASGGKIVACIDGNDDFIMIS